VAIGNVINPTRIAPSIAKIIVKSNKSKTIKNDFITIPMPREKPTSPCRYSFLRGLKKVLTKRGREKSSKNALLSEAKNPRILSGASTNQNLRKIKGSKRKLPIGQTT
jgi:5-formyltetrahydrofolate cyclo-ligase